MKRISFSLFLITLFTIPILAQWNNGLNAEFVVGQPAFTTALGGASSTSLYLPYDVAIDFTNNKMYVVDLGNHRVLRYSYPITGNQSAAELVFGQPDMTSNKPNRNSTAQANTLMYPTAVAILNGTLWICDQANHRILKFANAAQLTTNGPNADGVLGQVDFVTSTSGTSANKFNKPYDITFDSDGNLWVAEMQNHRVVRFNNAASKANGANADGVLGQANFTISTSATTQSGMNMPTGVVLYKRYLFVVDMGNNRVLKFTNAIIKPNGGNADGVFGQANFTSGQSNRGGAAGQNTMSMPFKAEIDGSARLYVSDQGNNRMLIFPYSNASSNGINAFRVLGQSNFTNTTGGTTQSIMKFTNGSAVDLANNKLIVADEENNRVLQFASVSDLIYYDPESIVYDPQGDRYFISSVGDGSVYVMNKNGKATYFNQGGSTSIRGLTIYNNQLYAAGEEGVNIYNLSTGQKITSIALPGKSFPNDIESDGAGNIYVSDDGARKIYKVVTSTQTASVLVDMGSEAPNGICYDKTNNRLLMVFGILNSPIKAVNLSTLAVTTVKNTNLGYLDGFTSDSQGNYYISSWNDGTIYKFDNSFSIAPIPFASGYMGPADIFFDKINNLLAIPDMIMCKITLIPLAGITVVKPNGGEVWRVGTIQNIQWTSSGVNNVKIEYTTNNGTNWNEVIASANAAAGTYAWTIPNTVSTNCLVKISDANNASLNDQSNAVFTIESQPSITVIKPNGGEVWRVGTIQNIQWTSTGVNNVKIEYTTNNGTDWIAIIASVGASTGIYAWTIPNTVSPNCLVRITDVSDPLINDKSNSLFGIDPIPSVTVVKPNGTEVWDIGTKQNIQWTSINVAEVKIEYSTNSGSAWVEVISKTSAANSTYQWTIPNTPSKNCLVRISDVTDANNKDQSNVVFTIQVPVSVNEQALPAEFCLYQNYPNPFNPSTIITFGIPLVEGESNNLHVLLKIYDMLGQEQITLVNEDKVPGVYSITLSLDKLKLTSGVYFYKIIAGKFVATKKMIILR